MIPYKNKQKKVAIFLDGNPLKIKYDLTILLF